MKIRIGDKIMSFFGKVMIVDQIYVNKHLAPFVSKGQKVEALKILKKNTTIPKEKDCWCDIIVAKNKKRICHWRREACNRCKISFSRSYTA